jgi:hypothetical protein
MSFSASTCVTNLAGVSSASTVQILTYPGNTPIGGNIILSAMTGSNCPYTITGIPNGTTMLKIFVPSTNVCGYIDISDNDLCNTCDLGFNSFTSTTVGNLVVGNLTGSCQNPITDYRILWFGPSESMSVVSTNVARISGKGSAFTYNYQHPLTGTSSLPMEEGYYRPVIDKIRINGVDFSYTGGTGYVPADLECFNSLPVYVSGYTCENGKETIGNYTHRVNFESTGGSLAPTPLTSTFILSGGTTNFFAWKFKGYGVPDQLKLTFFGSEYNFEPIILEWWEVGDNLNNINSMQNLNVFPKSADTPYYITKVTTLTGLTIHDEDRILLEVIPSKTNYNTSWDFYFTCLETFSCDTCLDNYKNESYKIIGNGVTGITGSCGTINISVPFSGCSYSSFYSSDMYKYMDTQGFKRASGNYYMSPNTFNLNSMGFNREYCSRFYPYQSYWGICGGSGSGSYISFKKDNTGSGGTGLIKMEFSGTSAMTNFNKFYDNYLYWKSNVYSSGSTDNTEYSYYRYLNLGISSATGTIPCGDSTVSYGYPIHHPTAIVTTGLTGGIYSLNITMPTITKGLFPVVCEKDCDLTINQFVDEINSASTGGTNNRTLITNVGASFPFPFQSVMKINQNYTEYTGGTYSGYYDINVNSLKTVPASGSSNTLIPSLSGQVCDYSSHGIFDSGLAAGYGANDGADIFRKDLFKFKVVLTNPFDVNDFNIYASPINNFVYSGYPSYSPYFELAYSYSGGSVVYSNPTYVI